MDSHYAYNMALSLDKISHVDSYSLPIGNQVVTNGTQAGVYAFIHEDTSHVGIGSAISCRSRLVDHMNSFNGHRSTTFLHD